MRGCGIFRNLQWQGLRPLEQEGQVTRVGGREEPGPGGGPAARACSLG